VKGKHYVETYPKSSEMNNYLSENIKFVLFYVLICVLNTSCYKVDEAMTDNVWQVESYKLHSDSTLQIITSTSLYYNLKFPDDSKYRLFTGHCSGEIEFCKDNIVKFENAECLKICCDVTSEDIKTSLINCNKYQLSGEYLLFQGEKGEEVNYIKN